MVRFTSMSTATPVPPTSLPDTSVPSSKPSDVAPSMLYSASLVKHNRVCFVDHALGVCPRPPPVRVALHSLVTQDYRS